MKIAVALVLLVVAALFLAFPQQVREYRLYFTQSRPSTLLSYEEMSQDSSEDEVKARLNHMSVEPGVRLVWMAASFGQCDVPEPGSAAQSALLEHGAVEERTCLHGRRLLRTVGAVSSPRPEVSRGASRRAAR